MTDSPRIVFFEKINPIYERIKTAVLFGRQDIMPYLCSFNSRINVRAARCDNNVQI